MTILCLHFIIEFCVPHVDVMCTEFVNICAQCDYFLFVTFSL